MIPAVPLGLDTLSPAQRSLLDEWLPGAELVSHFGFAHGPVTVLEVSHAGSLYVVKAAQDGDPHIGRELAAYRSWLAPWAGRAPRLHAGDAIAGILLAERIPGELVAGSAAERDPEIFRQAGELLAAFHGQASVEDETYEQQLDDRVLSWLELEHTIDAETEKRVRAELASWGSMPTQLVPTHGDWLPRVWVHHAGVVSVGDLGRFEFRPAISDFVRLSGLHFASDPTLEAAFVAGYGSDPRQSHDWHRDQLRQGVGAAVWAHKMGNPDVEAQAKQQLLDALAALAR